MIVSVEVLKKFKALEGNLFMRYKIMDVEKFQNNYGTIFSNRSDLVISKMCRLFLSATSFC
jgi:hypothetical protein